MIELRLAPALETLQSLPPDPSIDLAFIDADKGGYASYYEELCRGSAPAGVVLADNTLWSGRVADPAATDGDTRRSRPSTTTSRPTSGSRATSCRSATA